MKYRGSFRSFFEHEDVKESHELEHFSSNTCLAAVFALSCEFPFFARILGLKVEMQKNNF